MTWRRWTVVMALAIVADARGHALDPLLLDVTEQANGVAMVVWKAPPTRVTGTRVDPILPANCRRMTSPEASSDGGPVVMRWTVDCGAGGLVGQAIEISGLGPARTDALVRVALADGRVVQAIARARAPRVVIPARPTWAALSGDYVRLGVEHILSGPDHLAFVCGLLLLVGSPRRLIGTVSAFTLGHSLTLMAAVLGVVVVPAGPVELLIALSVFVLAVELARDLPGATLMRRYPWAVAGGFGLLHGLGFAGSLRAAGLPEGEVPLALAAFNVGVEIGQLGFIAVAVAAVSACRAALRWFGSTPAPWWRVVPAYTMGSLAALWCFERAAALVP